MQNHDQVANSLCGQRLHELADAGRAPGDDRAAAARAEYADAVSGTGICRFRDRFSTSPITGRSWRKLVADGRGGIPEAVSEHGLPGGRARAGCSRRRRRRRPFSAASSIIAERRNARARLSPCIAICCACAAAIRLLREARRTGWMARCSGTQAFVLRFFHEKGDRLLVINLGADLHLDPAPEPLLAPPAGRCGRRSGPAKCPDYGGSARRRSIEGKLAHSRPRRGGARADEGAKTRTHEC